MSLGRIRIVSDGMHDTHVYDEDLNELPNVRKITIEFEAGKPVFAHVECIYRVDGLDVRPGEYTYEIS